MIRCNLKGGGKEITEKRYLNFQRIISSEMSVVLVLIVLCTISAIFSPSFLTFENVINILKRASILGVISMGMTYVIITAGIDLSAGGQMVLIGTIGGFLMLRGLNLGFILLIMFFSGGIIGAINGFCISKLVFPPFIITLAMMNITRGLALYLTQGRTIFGFPESFKFFGFSFILGIPVSILILFIIFYLGHIGLKYNSFCRAVYAVGDNEKAAWLSGLDTKKVIFWVYVLQGFLAALGSIILVSRLQSATAAMAKGMELDAIASVVIGGTSLFGGEGNVGGTFIGVLIITIISNIMNLLGISPFLQDSLKGAVIILAVLLDLWRKGYLTRGYEK